MTGLLIGESERSAIADLMRLAAGNEVDVTSLAGRLQTPDGEEQHRAQMTRQSLLLPPGVLACFSIETGHPIGRCRHLSISIPNPAGVWVPGKEMAWMIAQEFGFQGDLDEGCETWVEKLRNRGMAVNIIQPIPS